MENLVAELKGRPNGINLESLEKAVLRSYDKPLEMSTNLSLVHEAVRGFKIPFIEQACIELIMRNCLDCQPTEHDVQRWLKTNVKTVFGDKYSLIKRKNDPKHIPDLWLLRGNEYIPVEVKLHEFSQRSFSQLTRYIKFYKCENGIAVAKRLECELPENVRFIAYDVEKVIGIKKE